MSGTIQALDVERDGFPGGPSELVLVGPPGTGKTRSVLDVWITPALSICRPDEVLACSFTKAAAGEMRGRLMKETGRQEWELMRVCSTIHSEALRMVRAEDAAVEVWKDGSKKTAAAPEPTTPRPQRQTDLGFGAEPVVRPPEVDPGGWPALSRPCRDLRSEALRIWAIARNLHPMKVGTVDAAKLLAKCAGESRFYVGDMAAVVEKYEDEKREAGAVDFVDMLLRCLGVPAPRRRLLVVDEAQDLSPLQVCVVEHWATQAKHLVWAGDPDQGIFGFAGADGKHLTKLMRSDIAVRSLQHSWRVPAAAHRVARRIVLRNRDRVDAPYEPSGAPGSVQFVKAPENGAEYAAARAEAGRRVFVLARTRAALVPYAKELSRLGVPFANERGESPLSSTSAVRLVLSVWRLVSGKTLSSAEAVQLAAALPGRPSGLYFKRTKKEAEAGLRGVADGSRLSREAIEGYGVRLDWAPVGGGDDGVVAALKAIGAGDGARALLRMAARAGGFSVLDYAPGITLTTIHASKGRERDVVVLDLSAPKSAVRSVRRSEASGDEERRVLYVGATRTMDELLLVRPRHNDSSVLLGVAL